MVVMCYGWFGERSVSKRVGALGVIVCQMSLPKVGPIRAYLIVHFSLLNHVFLNYYYCINLNVRIFRCIRIVKC